MASQESQRIDGGQLGACHKPCLSQIKGLGYINKEMTITINAMNNPHHSCPNGELVNQLYMLQMLRIPS